LASFQPSYPAKILLFGEYTVLLGGSGLSLPWFGCGAAWVQDPQAAPEFGAFIDFLASKAVLSKAIDTEALAADYADGWRLRSTIPFGSGLGSSGVLCAAIFDRYHRKERNLEETRKVLSGMEGYFHGRSSGLDPLVSFLKKAIVSRRDDLEVLAEIPKLAGPGFKIELVDSASPRETRALVEKFRARTDNDPQYRDLIAKELIPANEAAINGLLTNDHEAIIKHWQVISSLSLDVFRDMIPEQMRQIWMAGISSRRTFYKLCGAGGGGYFLKLSLL